jgi:hypothetical protein
LFAHIAFSKAYTEDAFELFVLFACADAVSTVIWKIMNTHTYFIIVNCTEKV